MKSESHYVRPPSDLNSSMASSPDDYHDAIEDEHDDISEVVERSFSSQDGIQISKNDLSMPPIDIVVGNEDRRPSVYRSGWGKLLSQNLRQKLEIEKSQNDVATTGSPSPRSISYMTENLSPGVQLVMQRQKQKYVERLKAQHREHAEQIDEIIHQLNEIEVKYQADILQLQGALSKKDLTIEALNASLAEMRAYNIRLMGEATQHQVIHSSLQHDYDKSVQSRKELETALHGLQNEHKITLSQQDRMIADAVRTAQDEIKLEAERQFAEANKLYVQLKKDFAAAVEERQLWAKRAEDTSAKMNERNLSFQNHIDDLTKQIEKLKDDLDSANVEYLKAKQVLITESTILKDQLDIKTRDLTRIEKDCAEAHQLVGTVVREKESLKRELLELRGVCEELMSIVEGKENNHI